MANAAVIKVATVVVIKTVAVAAATAVVVITVATEVATVVEILNLTLLIQINLLEQKVGKIEVMETLLKTQNMKVAELEGKGVFQMRVIPQMRKLSNPFL